jgi:glycosyltransferase involved in cell wall biosynthesis
MPLPYKPKILISVTVAETAFFFLSEQIPFLLQKGYAVEIVSGEGSWVKLAEVKRIFGVPVHTLPLTRNLNIFSDILSLAKLFLLMRKIKPDILYASTPKAALYSLIAGWLARVPVRIYLVRGIAYYYATGIARFVYFLLFKLACRLAHAVICVSESNKTFMLSNTMSAEKKTFLLCSGSSHGVDGKGKFDPEKADKLRIVNLKQKYGIAQGDIVFGFTGRIVKDKGIEDLVAVWITFVKKNIGSHCFIIGHKEARDVISPACFRDIESEPSIHLVSDIIDPFDYYCLFDVFVFPSYREGFPNSILEAAAMGIPVITTTALGCVDAVKNGETGYIVPVGNRAELFDKMDKLYSDKDLRVKLGNNARHFVLNFFNPADINSALDNFIRTLCKKRGRFAIRRIAIVTTVPATLYHLFSNQIERIKRDGFDVFLVSSAGDQWISSKDVEKKYGIKVHCVPFLRTFSVFSDMYTIFALCVLLVKLRLNVIYYCTPKASLLTAIAAFIMGVPFRI